MIKKLLQGMVVGIANIIPGVSGGTMMVAMGLYDKLIHAITHLKSEFKNSMKLLIPIFIGAGAAIVILSRLFEFLLENYPIPTNFAFCGLIAGSLPFIFNNISLTFTLYTSYNISFYIIRYIISNTITYFFFHYLLFSLSIRIFLRLTLRLTLLFSTLSF